MVNFMVNRLVSGSVARLPVLTYGGIGRGVTILVSEHTGLAGSLYCGLWRYCNCMVMDIGLRRYCTIWVYMDVWLDIHCLYIHAYGLEI